VAPSNLANFEPLIRKRTADVLDALPRNETFDWAERVSTDLTNMMLATLFDFPWEDRMKLSWWSDVAIANVDSPDAVVHSETERYDEMARMGEYFRKLWDVRANAPPTFDLVSMLAHSEATRHLQPREFIGTMALLIVGGNDTTRNSMSGGLMALVENPEQFELVRARRELIPEPRLRDHPLSHAGAAYAPHRAPRRRTRRPPHRQGRQGRDVVHLRQPRREQDRPRRRVHHRPRQAAQHLAFGAGIHRCVGDRLAEQQIRILWEEILNRDLRFRNSWPAAAALFKFHPRHPLATGEDCELVPVIPGRLEEANPESRDSGFAPSCPGMTREETRGPSHNEQARSR
jgi:cytochrome P450